MALFHHKDNLMTDIRFYHMTLKTLEKALPELLAKALERYPRIVVKAADADQVATLDTLLWTYDPASFMPHGAAADEFAAEQPVFLTTEDHNPNGANMIVLTGGATTAAVEGYDLCCELFDGNDETAVQEARNRWSVYKEAGHELTYFQQDDNGRWIKK